MFPKFDVEYALPEGGLHLSGDYSGTLDGPIQISVVFHKAVLEVNEEGTEAFATTTMVMNRAFVMSPADAFEMIVNRPFFFPCQAQPH